MKFADCKVESAATRYAGDRLRIERGTRAGEFRDLSTGTLRGWFVSPVMIVRHFPPHQSPFFVEFSHS